MFSVFVLNVRFLNVFSFCFQCRFLNVFVLNVRFLNVLCFKCPILKRFVFYSSAAQTNTHEAKGWPPSAYGMSKVLVTVMTFIQHRLMLNDPREDIVINAVRSFTFFTLRARCSSVVRAFDYGAMGHRIDRSWWTH